MGAILDFKILDRLTKIENALLRIADAIERLVPPAVEQQLDPETSVALDDEDEVDKEEEPLPDGPE